MASNKKIQIRTYPTLKTPANVVISSLKPNSQNYKQIFDFFENFLGIEIDETNYKDFAGLITSVFSDSDNKQMFYSYMNTKTSYEKKQYDMIHLLNEFITSYEKETGKSFPYLSEEIVSADQLSLALELIGLQDQSLLDGLQNQSLFNGTSATKYGQLKKCVTELSDAEIEYSRKYAELQVQAEKSMSNVRNNFYEFEQKSLNSNTSIEDKFTYAFFRTFKGSDGMEKIRVDFLDAEAVSKKMLESDYMRTYQNFGSTSGFFRSASLRQTKGFTEEDFTNLRVKDQTLQNFAQRINNDSDFLKAIQNLSKEKYKNENGEDRTVGFGRAADILFKNYDYKTGWSGIIPKITGKDMNENVAGLLLGDKTIDITDNGKITRYQISVKTQKENNILIDYSSSNIIEAMYFVGTDPNILANVFAAGGYGNYGYNQLRNAALETAFEQKWTYLSAGSDSSSSQSEYFVSDDDPVINKAVDDITSEVGTDNTFTIDAGTI